MAVPNIFGSATSAIPLSQLDTNFATPVTIGNTAVQLGNTVTSFGNVTLTNVTISSGNVTVTGANVSGTANVSTLVVTGNAVVSVTDNTNAALRITQLGTGNALLVEDTTNPDATPFVIDAGGNTVVGATSAYATVDSSNTARTPLLQNHGLTQSTANTGIFNWSSSTGSAAYLSLNKSKSGTVGTQTAVSSGDDIGAINFAASDGTAFVTAANILAEVDGTPGTNDMPGRLVFSTTADGASTPTERMRINSAGGVGIGTTTPVTRLEIAGTNNTAWSVTASITGTTMDVTAVTTSGVAVGDLVHGSGVQPYTRVTALGTGTGGIGTYTVSVSQTLASGTVVGCPTYGNTLIRITETDTAVTTGQPTGGLQFYTSDNSTPTAGVGAYVAGVAESNTPDTSLVFGTRDGSGGGIDANERMRIDSSGYVLAGYSSAFDLSPTGTGQYAGISVSTSSSPNWKLGALSFSADTTANGLLFVKSRSATVGTNTVVQSGDALGNIVWRGADGTNYINAAAIQAWVDGTPGTNDMPGRITFSTTADGSSSITERMRIDSSGNVLVTNVAGLGYGTGSGGTVTQATSKTTGVTLNKPTGQITMNNAALAANTTVRFLVTNSIASVTDCIMVTIRDGVTAGAYLAWVDGTANGSFTMAVRNITAGSLSDAVVLNFSVIKGATS